MSKNEPEFTSAPKENAFLVGVEIRGHKSILSMDDSLAELSLLADTAGLEVVGEITQKIEHPNPSTLIGSGKIEELVALVEESLAQVIIFDDELSPRHQRELESMFRSGVRIIDRTALILDIFAQHAHSREGQLQVKLAQMEYYLPRLTGRWTHLARQAGGGGGRSGSVGGVGLRGPGETQLEVDKRSIRREISKLEETLDKVRSQRSQYRSQRKRNHIPVVSIVGYTNSGKSTLLNRLSDSEVLVADQLFATLDPTTRRVELPGSNTALFTDTVGFIQKLPTSLIAAFQATLEEISESNLLLHVIDISHPNSINHAEAVYVTLKEINADKIPIISVLNKIDLLSDPGAALKVSQHFPRAIAISALEGTGIPELLERVHKELFEQYLPITIFLPYQQGQLISLFHEHGQIDHLEYLEEKQSGVKIIGRVPKHLYTSFSPWEIKPKKGGK